MGPLIVMSFFACSGTTAPEPEPPPPKAKSKRRKGKKAPAEHPPDHPGRACYDMITPAALPEDVEAVAAWSQVEGDGDHAYGREVRLMRKESTCFGVLLDYDGDIAPRWAVLQQVRCALPAGPLSFTTSRVFVLGYDDIGPIALHASFTGEVDADGALTGAFTDAEGAETAFASPSEKLELATTWEHYHHLLQTSRCVGGYVSP